MRRNLSLKNLTIAKKNTEAEEQQEAQQPDKHLEGLTPDEKRVIQLLADVFIKSVLKNDQN